MKKIIIGARSSILAQVQANLVKDAIIEMNNQYEVDIVSINTLGDQNQNIHWKNSSVSLKGLFTNELSNALLNSEIDIAVHSLKDMPTKLNYHLDIIGYLFEEDCRDAFLSNEYQSIYDLPLQAVVGTSSKRREMQIRELREDLIIKPIRGNIHTRINKLENKEYDAIILAAAGLKRVNLEHHIKQYFNINEMIPASGQGILGIEGRKDDTFIKELISSLCLEKTQIRGKTERTFSKIFDAGCTTPVGAHAKIKDDYLMLSGLYYHENIKYEAYVEGPIQDHIALAYQLSNQIKKQYQSSGKVYLLGAGPGNPDLVTYKGHKLLKECDCILYDRLVSNELLAIVNPDAKKIYVGKEDHNSSHTQSLINQSMINAALEYQTVVRLKGGDPLIYGRAFEEVLALKEYCIDYEIIPGISSFQGAAASTSIPITDRNSSNNFHVYSGHGKNNTEHLDYQTISQTKGNLIFYMAIKKIKKILIELVKHGYPASTDIAFIENATTFDERIIKSNLHQVIETDLITKIKNPAIIIIGPAITYHNQFNWDACIKPITLLSTREQRHYDDFNKLCNFHNLKSLSAPQISIETIDKLEKANLTKVDIILFNSVNGVKIFLENNDASLLKDKIIGATGSKTLKILNENNLEVKIIPQVYNMEELVTHTTNSYPNKDILIVASLQTKFDLIKWQRRLTSRIEAYFAYDTKVLVNENDYLIKQINNSNVLCFFSASSVDAFMHNINYQFALLTSKKIASIGPYTTKQLLKYQIEVDIQPTTATQEDLIMEVKKYYAH